MTVADLLKALEGVDPTREVVLMDDHPNIAHPLKEIELGRFDPATATVGIDELTEDYQNKYRLGMFHERDLITVEGMVRCVVLGD